MVGRYFLVEIYTSWAITIENLFAATTNAGQYFWCLSCLAFEDLPQPLLKEGSKTSLSPFFKGVGGIKS
jgi:hypothetical protein